jgi:signal transduction histidine kinase
VALGFAAAILCLVATVVATNRLEATRDEEAHLVHHTSETLLALEALEGAFRLATTSLHAQLGEGAAWEHGLTRRALERVEPALARVDLLVADDPPQHERFGRLAPLVRGVAGTVQQAAASLEAGDRARALALLDDVGPTVLAPVDELFRELADTEARLLEARLTTWRRAAVTGAVVFSIATAVLLVLILLAARLVRAEISARERLSAERADMLALQQQLMAIVSHDLRSPLAAMKSAAALIVRCETVGDEHREGARRVVSNARRMERLIRDLLDFSRLRAGHALPIHPARTDLVDVCRLAVSDLGRDAEGRVAVEGRGDVSGEWDQDRLEQVAANLVSNAIKYGPAHRPVRIVVDGDGEAEVRLSVHDEGGGLRADRHEEIFEPFRRGVAGDTEEAHSAGLGLYIVRRIAEAHGGEVTVASAPATGTTFTVRLPRRPAPGGAPAAAGG